MKRFLGLLAGIILLPAVVCAQETRIGLRVGGSFSSIALEDADLEVLGLETEADGRLGLEIGATFDVAFSDNLAIQPSVLFSIKGHKYDQSNVLIRLERDVAPLYIQIPLPLVVKSSPNSIRFLAGAGPYAAYGIGGSFEGSAESLGSRLDTDRSINWGSDDEDDFTPLDYGVVALAGIEASGLQVAVTYEYGLRNIYAGDTENYSVKNRVVSVSATYFLGM